MGKKKKEGFNPEHLTRDYEEGKKSICVHSTELNVVIEFPN